MEADRDRGIAGDWCGAVISPLHPMNKNLRRDKSKMRAGSRTLIVGLAAIAVLSCADAAWAWGPATHVELGGAILSRLGLLPAAIAAILARHRIAYLYGNIAADIVFAKRLSRVKQFCHHWSTAFRLLESARDDRGESFAYGYLSHLAADTVAHGKYIPRQIAVSNCSMNFGHFYWELRADAAQTSATWGLLEDLLEYDHDHHHASLQEHITDTFLSYELNRLLFDRMNALTVRQGFRRTMGLWHRYSRWDLSPDLLAGYRNECLERIISVLSEGGRSPVLRFDPNGTSALMDLHVRRRELTRMRRRGAPTRRRLLEATHTWAPQATVTKQPVPEVVEA